MPEQVRQELVRPFGSIDFIDLRTADAAAEDFDQHLAEPQRWRLDLLDDQRLFQLQQDCGFEFHSK